MSLADAVGAFSKFNPWAWLRAMSDNNLAIIPNAGAPTNGTSGTFAGKAGPGCLLVDTTNAVLYVNVGTKASPVWSAISAISGNAGLGVVQSAKVTYDFAVDGGAQGTITPANSPQLPSKAIILGGALDITTTLTSGGSATIALGTSAGSSTTSLKGATAVASWTAGFLAIVPVFTAATYVKLSAAGKPTLTIATADLTDGKFDLNLVYCVGN